MSEEYFPFATGSGADSTAAEFTKMGFGMSRPGVLLGFGGELLITAGSGLNVTAKSGAFVGFGHYYGLTADKTVAVPANATGSNRWDRVVVRMDFVAETITVAVKTGSSGAPPALTKDATNVWEESLAVIVTTPGGNVSGIYDALDRWAMPYNQGDVGSEYTYYGLATTLPKYAKVCDGVILDRWNYEKLWAVMPPLGPPSAWGNTTDGTNKIKLPDMRGRASFGLDTQGSGNAARIDAPDNLGGTLGSSGLDHLHLPAHYHYLPNHEKQSPAVVVGVLGGINFLGGASTPGRSAQPVLLANFDTILQSTDGAVPVGATELNAGGLSDNALNDNNMPPSVLCYKAIRIA